MGLLMLLVLVVNGVRKRCTQLTQSRSNHSRIVGIHDDQVVSLAEN
jgi:hypothetical protein